MSLDDMKLDAFDLLQRSGGRDDKGRFPQWLPFGTLAVERHAQANDNSHAPDGIIEARDSISWRDLHEVHIRVFQNCGSVVLDRRRGEAAPAPLQGKLPTTRKPLTTEVHRHENSEPLRNWNARLGP